MYLYVHMLTLPTEARTGIRTPEVIGRCDLLDLGDCNKLGSSIKAVSALYC